jgi:hypothetical protein
MTNTDSSEDSMGRYRINTSGIEDNGGDSLDNKICNLAADIAYDEMKRVADSKPFYTDRMLQFQALRRMTIGSEVLRRAIWWTGNEEGYKAMIEAILRSGDPNRCEGRTTFEAGESSRVVETQVEEEVASNEVPGTKESRVSGKPETNGAYEVVEISSDDEEDPKEPGTPRAPAGPQGIRRSGSEDSVNGPEEK